MKSKKTFVSKTFTWICFFFLFEQMIHLHIELTKNEENEDLITTTLTPNEEGSQEEQDKSRIKTRKSRIKDKLILSKLCRIPMRRSFLTSNLQTLADILLSFVFIKQTTKNEVCHLRTFSVNMNKVTIIWALSFWFRVDQALFKLQEK